MKKVLSLVALAMISTIMFAVNDGVKACLLYTSDAADE